MTGKSEHRETTFIQALIPVAALLLIIIYGLILRPRVFDISPMPLEIIFLSAAVLAFIHLSILGYSWKEIQDSIVTKLSRALPTIFILFAIGLIIGSWIVCGTIPMFVYYGIEIINPKYLYVLAFIVPAVFSTFTGTSWGSVGTIGVVIMGVAGVVDGHLGITAGAIVGGAYFGDKMSPLSDTTNVAAMAVEVSLYDHIRSMTVTTFPSAAIALIIFLVLGTVYPAGSGNLVETQAAHTAEAIDSLFRFHIVLLLPPIVVLYGSIRRKPVLPTLLASTLVAFVLTLLVQDFALTDNIQSVYKGFDTTMATWVAEVPSNVQALFNRGGLYELNEPIIISIMVFIFIGIIDKIDAMPIIVERVFGFAKSRAALIISSLFSTGITNAMTSNQYATSFVVGDAFKSKYDKLGIHRKVLSRSLEDYGTMLESIIPWHTSGVFMVTTLGIAFADYWHWQLLSLINLVIAPLLALLGIGVFRNTKSEV